MIPPEKNILQTLQWIPWPRAGTSLKDGRWLCTVNCPGEIPPVTFLTLEAGTWFEDDGCSVDESKILAIALCPRPYPEPEPSEIGGKNHWDGAAPAHRCGDPRCCP